MKKRVARIDKSIINSCYIDEQLDKNYEQFVSIFSLVSGYFVTEYLHHIKMLTSENYKFALAAIEIIFFAVSMGGLYGCRYVNNRNKQERRMLSFCCNDLSPHNISYMHDDVLELYSSADISAVNLGRFQLK
jgi:hypothetical protein